MLVSVIVPVYNVDKYLEECLMSLINQTYDKLEILCVNDGSTDRSLDILQRFSKLDKRIKIISKDNGGVSSARNTGLDLAMGDIVSFVDSDDYIHKDTYKLVVDKFISDKKLDIVEFGYREFYEDGSVVDTIAIDINNIVREKLLFYNKKKSAISYFVCTKCIKKNLLYDIRFPQGKYYEDNIFNFRLLHKTDKISFISQPLYYYRQRKGSITSDTFSDKLVDLCSTLDEYYEELSDEKTKKELSLYIISSIINRIEFSIYNYGIRGGLFYFHLFEQYINKHKSKGLGGLPFCSLFYKMKVYVFCRATMLYIFSYAMFVPLYKFLKKIIILFSKR